jgi:hypothetical protein
LHKIAEEWRAVRDWEGFYEVSSLGRVRSVERIQVRGVGRYRTPTACLQKCKLLKPAKNDRGYMVVILADTQNGRRKTAKVHRLVCEAFNGPPPEGHEVAHNDNTRDNNVADNLRWATHYDNIQDRVRALACQGV